MYNAIGSSIASPQPQLAVAFPKTSRRNAESLHSQAERSVMSDERRISKNRPRFGGGSIIYPTGDGLRDLPESACRHREHRGRGPERSRADRAGRVSSAGWAV